MSVSTKLDALKLAIHESFDSLAATKTEHEWNRGQMYREAKKLMPSTKEYNKWLEEVMTIPSTGKAREGKTIRANLTSMADYFTREEYLSIGYTNSAELIQNKSLWVKHKEQMLDLKKRVLDKELITQKQIGEQRDLIRDGGVPKEVKPKEPKKKEKTPLEEQMAQLMEQNTALLGILANTYRYTEEEFFHPEVNIRGAQINRMTESDKYLFLFWGLPILSVDEMSEGMIRQAESRVESYSTATFHGELVAIYNRIKPRFPVFEEEGEEDNWVDDVDSETLAPYLEFLEIMAEEVAEADEIKDDYYDQNLFGSQVIQAIEEEGLTWIEEWESHKEEKYTDVFAEKFKGKEEGEEVPYVNPVSATDFWAMFTADLNKWEWAGNEDATQLLNDYSSADCPPNEELKARYEAIKAQVEAASDSIIEVEKTEETEEPTPTPVFLPVEEETPPAPTNEQIVARIKSDVDAYGMTVININVDEKSVICAGVSDASDLRENALPWLSFDWVVTVEEEEAPF